jgi:hypothetical protein
LGARDSAYADGCRTIQCIRYNGPFLEFFAKPKKMTAKQSMGDIDAAVKALKAGVDVLKVLAQVVSSFRSAAAIHF